MHTYDLMPLFDRLKIFTELLGLPISSKICSFQLAIDFDNVTLNTNSISLTLTNEQLDLLYGYLAKLADRTNVDYEMMIELENIHTFRLLNTRPE